jgi:hypothetical protein
MILVARGDCFYEADRDELYDWDSGSESRFDRRAKPLNQDFEDSPPRVEEVVVDAVGGFFLRLARGYIFEVFPADGTGTGSEHWRFFQPGKDQRHFVFHT